ncbi:hypothetical protein M3Y97_00841500 [Aphelenchoides bicaudatus]|nr:hypothetical protein M3Y97_00841500 [Aphelenchoides bicaudatus]
MDVVDTIVFVLILLLISIVGVFFGRRNSSKNTHNELLVGSNVSAFNIALSVCSSFLSAVSLLGFPSEVYFRGSSVLWFLAVYAISFPTVAYVFLPVFYNLKVSSIYEYLEKRFSFTCRLLASLTFITQTILYLAVALYAPALALSQCLDLPMIISIVATALISAIYLFIGGAKAGIHTSALQMALIICSLLIVCVASMASWDANMLWKNSEKGLRLDPNDFQLNPQARHSVWAFLIGATFNLFSLFGTNQLTLQRYMGRLFKELRFVNTLQSQMTNEISAMPTLKQAQKVVLLNIPMNSIMIFMYTFLGLVTYSIFHGCHPTDLETSDKILPYFIANKLNWIVGLEGLFMASVYSAGISTLTASYNALTAVVIEDVIKVTVSRFSKNHTVLNAQIHLRIIQLLPFVFAFIAMLLAILVGSIKTMILQTCFSVFGALGGAVLSVFIVGLFFPYINSKYAALAGQIAAILACGYVSIGSLYYKVTPVNLPLVTQCLANSSNISFEYSESFGMVTAQSSGGVWAAFSKISYHYYSVVGVLVGVIVANVVQLILKLLNLAPRRKVNSTLLVHFLRVKPPNIVIEAAESQCLSKNCSEN